MPKVARKTHREPCLGFAIVLPAHNKTHAERIRIRTTATFDRPKMCIWYVGHMLSIKATPFTARDVILCAEFLTFTEHKTAPFDLHLILLSRERMPKWQKWEFASFMLLSLNSHRWYYLYAWWQHFVHASRTRYIYYVFIWWLISELVLVSTDESCKCM